MSDTCDDPGCVCHNATNPKDLQGVKKPQLNLIPMASMVYQAIAMEDGKNKYGQANWREKKIQASIYIAATMRHLMQWQEGEENAEDSGKPHLAHAIACLGILVDALEGGNLIDDRPIKGPGAQTLKKWTKEKT